MPIDLGEGCGTRFEFECDVRHLARLAGRHRMLMMRGSNEGWPESGTEN